MMKKNGIQKKKQFGKIVKSAVMLAGCLSLLVFGSLEARADEAGLITTTEELKEAIMNAQDGDTILVGDITFTPMPMGMMQVPKNLVIKSGKEEHAVFTDATFALNGTASDAAPLKVRFEGIDFKGDNAESGIDAENPPNISSKAPGIMKTMCAGIFKMNLDVTYKDCSFTGYHYGYGGVINAIYSSDDNKNELSLTLENCDFETNAGSYGGALYLIGKNHNITLRADKCRFVGNAAATGGAIWAEEANVTLTDCTFSENKYLNDEVTNAVGGALALYNCASELENCVLKNNDSLTAGGGIFCEVYPFYTMVIRNCTLDGNSAETDAAVSVVPGETNFSADSKAYLYFTSMVHHAGDNGLLQNESVSLFGCLLADEEGAEQEPSEENGYCYCLPGAAVAEKGYAANAQGRVIPSKGTAIPKAALETAAGGRFVAYAGRLVPGDCDLKELSAEPILCEEADSGEEGQQEAAQEPPVAASADAVEKSKAPAVMIGILALAAIAGLIVWYRYYRNKSAAQTEEPESKGDAEATAANLPANWIERVCENPEIKELLSNREMEVLPLLLEGQSREQIAKRLFISENTVKKHSSSIYAKFKVAGKAELIAKMAANK